MFFCAQVLSWFLDHEKQNGLFVCRLKNKFACTKDELVCTLTIPHTFKATLEDDRAACASVHFAHILALPTGRGGGTLIFPLTQRWGATATSCSASCMRSELPP